MGLAIRWKIGTNGGLWRDEALSVFIAELPSLREMLAFLRLHESHPPLFYAMLREWISLFGKGETSMMALPICFGAAQIPATYLAGRLFFSPRAGIIAAALTSVSPALVEQSAVIRPYSFLPLAVLVGATFLIVAIEKGRWVFWAGFALTLLAISLTHNWALLVGLGYFAAVVISIPRFPRSVSRTLSEAALAFGFAAAAYLPWFKTLLFQSGHAGYAPLEFHDLFGTFRIFAFTLFLLLRSTFLGAVSAIGFPIVIGSLIVAAVTALAGFGRDWRSSRPQRKLTPPRVLVSTPEAIATRVFLATAGVSVLAAVAFSAQSNLLIIRCLTMLTPLILVLSARWIARRWTDLSMIRGGQAFALAAGIVLLGNNSAALASMLARPRSNARELAGNITTLTRKDDFVIVAPVWLASSFNFYYSLPVEQFDFPDPGRQEAVGFANLWERIGNPRALMNLQAEIMRATAENRRIWLVTDSESLKPLSPADSMRAREPGHFEDMGTLRVGEIRALLANQYGPPKTLGVLGEPARFEQLVGFLYSRGDHE